MANKSIFPVDDLLSYAFASNFQVGNVSCHDLFGTRDGMKQGVRGTGRFFRVIERGNPARILNEMTVVYRLAACMTALLAATVCAAQQQVGQKHPFYECGLYPEWGEFTAEQGAIDLRAGMELAKQRLEKIRELKPNETNYENVFAAFENAPREMERAESYLDTMASTMDSEELRRVQEEMLPEMTLFHAAIMADEKLWNVIKTASEAPWVKRLSPEKQRYVRQVVDTFHDSGTESATCPSAQRALHACSPI